MLILTSMLRRNVISPSALEHTRPRPKSFGLLCSWREPNCHRDLATHGQIWRPSFIVLDVRVAGQCLDLAGVGNGRQQRGAIAAGYPIERLGRLGLLLPIVVRILEGNVER